MKSPRRAKFLSFAGALAAVTASAALTRACPGSCGPCSQCVNAVAPSGAAFAAVGLTLAAASARRRPDKSERESE